MLVNWRMYYLSRDREDIQPPDKYVEGLPYWFFRYWPDSGASVDVLDFCRVPGLHTIEKKVIRFYVLQAARALARAGGYDLIISHGAQSGVVLAALRRMLGRRMPPHVIIDIGCFNGGRERRLELAPIRYAARSLAGVIYHASVQQEYYQRNMPRLPARFVPFGVDTEFFRPRTENAEDYAVAIGSYLRDYRTLLAAWRQLPPGMLPLKLMGAKLRVGNLPPGVELLDWIPIDDFKRVVARARLVVLPLKSKKYAYGQMSLLQAMAMAKAVVVSRVPSVVDYVSDGVDALVVEPGDTDALAQAVAALHSDPDRISTLEAAARATAERFNEARMAADIHAFVSMLVSG